jgi:hypothetical protein
MTIGRNKMANENKNEKKATAAVKNLPVVSDIPLPATANQLVIDLPDGQKLVIGTMATGAVIEVATWRGTGRPDSRTNRLMLGMSDPQAASAPTPTDKFAGNSTPSVSYASSPEAVKKKAGIPNISGYLKSVSPSKLVDKFFDTLKSLTSSVKVMTEKSKELEPVETTSELNINAWIEQISQEAQAKVERSQNRKTAATKRSN